MTTLILGRRRQKYHAAEHSSRQHHILTSVSNTADSAGNQGREWQLKQGQLKRGQLKRHRRKHNDYLFELFMTYPTIKIHMRLSYSTTLEK
jgi:hypothetical protein